MTPLNLSLPFSLTEKEEGAIATLVIRGSTDNLMDDIERAIDDGVNTFKVLVRVSVTPTVSECPWAHRRFKIGDVSFLQGLNYYYSVEMLTLLFLLQDKRLLPGAGATEIELARKITSYGEVRRFDVCLNWALDRSV